MQILSDSVEIIEGDKKVLACFYGSQCIRSKSLHKLNN